MVGTHIMVATNGPSEKEMGHILRVFTNGKQSQTLRLGPDQYVRLRIPIQNHIYVCVVLGKNYEQERGQKNTTQYVGDHRVCWYNPYYRGEIGGSDQMSLTKFIFTKRVAQISYIL